MLHLAVHQIEKSERVLVCMLAVIIIMVFAGYVSCQECIKEEKGGMLMVCSVWPGYILTC